MQRFYTQLKPHIDALQDKITLSGALTRSGNTINVSAPRGEPSFYQSGIMQGNLYKNHGAKSIDGMQCTLVSCGTDLPSGTVIEAVVHFSADTSQSNRIDNNSWFLLEPYISNGVLYGYIDSRVAQGAEGAPQNMEQLTNVKYVIVLIMG